MSAKINLLGKTFGRLKVVAEAGICERRGGVRWLCRCACGRMKTLHRADLRNGDTQSCGCLDREKRAERVGNRTRTHGLSGSSTYNIWAGMRQRCGDSGCKDYPNYGGRGIAVCERWEDSFENFLADMGQKPARMTLDRRDNNGNYAPDNCRWASTKQQSRNNRGNRLVRIGDETRCLVEWMEFYEISTATVRGRLGRGWDAARALSTPPDSRFNQRAAAGEQL